MSMARLLTERGHAQTLVVTAPVLYDAQPQKTVEEKRDSTDHGSVVVIGAGRPQTGGCNRRNAAPNHHGGACVSPDPRDFFPADDASKVVPSKDGKTAA